LPANPDQPGEGSPPPANPVPPERKAPPPRASYRSETVW